MIEKEDRSPHRLRLESVAVEVRIYGAWAETRTTLTFFNPTHRILAGDLYFPLPEGSTVAGYALDVRGRMVDGVVVEKERVRRIYEAEVRKGIDPGLVEWTKGNNFKTRVFPIPPQGRRTIRVDYVSELIVNPEETIYFLPLCFPEKVDQFSLRIEVVKTIAKPVIRTGSLTDFTFEAWRDSYLAEIRLRDVSLADDLYVGLPHAATQGVWVEHAPDGMVYFAIRDLAPPILLDAAPIHPRRILILWDASASREGIGRAREIALLQRYLDMLSEPIERVHAAHAATQDAPSEETDRAQKTPQTLPPLSLAIDLFAFRNDLEKIGSYTHATRDELLASLKRIPYDGGTCLGACSLPPDLEKPELILLFSDGLGNLGTEDLPSFPAPLFVLNASSVVDHGRLRALALQNRGRYLNLTRLGENEALSQIGAVAPLVLDRVECTDGGAIDLYPQLPEPIVHSVAAVGKLIREEAEVTLIFASAGHERRRKTYRIRRADAGEGTLLRRAWAERAMEPLLLAPQKNAKALVDLGKEYGVVTSGTSLLVLERLDQYVAHRVMPPESLPGMREEYLACMKRRANEKVRSEADKLERVFAMWKAHIAWWETPFPVKKRIKEPQTTLEDILRRALGGPLNLPERSARLDSSPERTFSETLFLGDVGKGEQSSALSVQDGVKEKTAPLSEDKEALPTSVITLKPWDPATPYLAAIRAAPPEEQYKAYLKERAIFGASPGFFLDCAEHFRTTGRESLAIRILTNLAERELENAALLRVLAHRLLQLDQLDLAIAVFEEVLRLHPEEPQSRRDLALALARRADAVYDVIKIKSMSQEVAEAYHAKIRPDYSRAIELLWEIVRMPWDRFEEIEIIALVELNRILPRARDVGCPEPKIDPRFVKCLDMDLRVVMTWDADMTDMDLHVVEPSGEEACYSHNRTSIGGLVTRDFTQGYGPEAYQLRKAIAGTYRVKTKYYGSSAPLLLGPVTLQVDIFIDYARPTEKRKSLTLYLTKGQEIVTVGDIRIP